MNALELLENLIALDSKKAQSSRSKLTAMARQLSLISNYGKVIDPTTVGLERVRRSKKLQERLNSLFFSEDIHKIAGETLYDFLPVRIAQTEIEETIKYLKSDTKFISTSS
jgi:hypothetical protein